MAVSIDPLKTGTSDEVNPTFTTLTVSGAATIGGGLAVTGSIVATGQVAAPAFASSGYDASSYSTKLLLAGSATADNFTTFIATNGAGRTYYMGPGAGDGQVASFALYDNTSGATRWRSTASGFDVIGAVSATDNIANLRSGNALITNETTVNGAHSEIVMKGPNSVGTARQANMGLNRFADDVWSLSDGTTEYLRVNLVSGGLAVTGSISATDYLAGAEQTPPSAPAANGYRIFAQDNGAGKTQLMVLFASGAAQQIAIEP